MNTKLEVLYTLLRVILWLHTFEHFYSFMKLCTNQFKDICVPSLATRRLEIASGILVPAARNTKPMITSGIPNVNPIKDT